MRASILLVLVCLAAAAQAPSSNDPIARISEGTIDFTNPSTDTITYSCVEVSRDGSAYMIKRQQKILSGSGATVRAYQGILNSSSLNTLNSLLGQDALLRLPDVGSPHFSGDSAFVHGVLITVYRGNSIQRIHADDWYDKEGKHYKLNGGQATQEYVQGQKKLNERTKPIMQWFHALNMSAFHPAAREGDRCMD